MSHLRGRIVELAERYEAKAKDMRARAQACEGDVQTERWLAFRAEDQEGVARDLRLMLDDTEPPALAGPRHTSILERLLLDLRSLIRTLESGEPQPTGNMRTHKGKRQIEMRTLDEGTIRFCVAMLHEHVMAARRAMKGAAPADSLPPVANKELPDDR